MLEHSPNSIQDMSNSTVISDAHSHRFDFATPTDLLDPSPMKNQGKMFFVGPGSGIPSHDTLRHSHQLKCTQIRIPHTEKPVNNVPGLIWDSDGVLTLEPRPSYMTPSESVYNWLLSRLEFPVSSNLIEMPHQVKSDSDFFTPEVGPRHMNPSAGAYSWLIHISEAHSPKDLLVTFPCKNLILMFFDPDSRTLPHGPLLGRLQLSQTHFWAPRMKKTS